MVPVSIPQKKGNPIEVNQDEDYKKIDFNKMASLLGAFDKEGTITAANASNINDGAPIIIAFIPDAHTLLIFVTGIESGKPAASIA